MGWVCSLKVDLKHVDDGAENFWKAGIWKPKPEMGRKFKTGIRTCGR
jgi:hypothetical protein